MAIAQRMGTLRRARPRGGPIGVQRVLVVAVLGLLTSFAGVADARQGHRGGGDRQAAGHKRPTPVHCRARGAAAARGGTPAPRLPADLPAHFPLPAGRLYGSTGCSPHWTIQLTVAGLHQPALATARTFYLARGYQVVPRPGLDGALLRNRRLRISLLTSDIDHGVGVNTSALSIQIDRI